MTDPYRDERESLEQRRAELARELAAAKERLATLERQHRPPARPAIDKKALAIGIVLSACCIGFLFMLVQSMRADRRAIEHERAFEASIAATSAPLGEPTHHFTGHVAAVRPMDPPNGSDALVALPQLREPCTIDRFAECRARVICGRYRLYTGAGSCAADGAFEDHADTALDGSPTCVIAPARRRVEIAEHFVFEQGRAPAATYGLLYGVEIELE